MSALPTLTEKKAARVGAWSFCIGGFLQSLVTSVVILVGFFIEFAYRPSDIYIADATDEFVALPWFTNILIVMVLGTLVYAGMAALLGRMAGKTILIRKVPYGWVGMMVMVLPAIVTPMIGTVLISLIREGTLLWQGHDFFHWVLEPYLMLVAILLLPGLLIGVLSGLLTRQWGRSILSKMQSQTMES